ncbi:hypothetical protein PHYSODRAFT_378292, partial [Phytophthora sojae]
VSALGMYLACNPRKKIGTVVPRFRPQNSIRQGDGRSSEKSRTGKSYGTHSYWIGDRVLGRVVADLPANASKFAGLTPHFIDNS